MSQVSDSLKHPPPGSSVQLPFQIFVGCWVGVGTLFSESGDFIGSVSSTTIVTAHEDRSVRYLVYEQKFNEKPETTGTDVIKFCPYDQRFKYRINDKVAIAEEIEVCKDGAWIKRSNIKSVKGHMSTNNNYLFVIKYIDGSELNNNHYFGSVNTRSIIGQILNPEDCTKMLVSQTFTAFTPASGERQP